MTIRFKHRVVSDSDAPESDIDIRVFGSFAEAERAGCRACGTRFDSLAAVVRRNLWVNNCVQCGEYTWYEVDYFFSVGGKDE